MFSFVQLQQIVTVLCLSSQGKCFPCGHTECPLMGHHADKFPVTDDTSISKYFLTTGSSTPFRRKELVLSFDYHKLLKLLAKLAFHFIFSDTV